MRARSILALLLLALLLGACGSETAAPAAEASPASEPPAVSAAPETEPSLAPEEDGALSLEESQAMARFLNAGRALLEDGALYCYDFDEHWESALASYSWKKGELGEYKVLARGCVPEYLCHAAGALYYIDRLTGALERVPEKGGEREILWEGPCTDLSLREERLYLCDGAGRFLSLDLDGGDEQVLLPGPCAWAYPLEGAILYRDLGDEGRLHLRDRESGEDRALTDGAAWAPLLLDGQLWYQDDTGLHSRALAGGPVRDVQLPEAEGDIELLPLAEGLLLRGIRDGIGPEQWEGPPGGPYQQMARGYRVCDWLGGGYRIDTIYEPDRRIRCFLLTGEDGTEISFLAGHTL